MFHLSSFIGGVIIGVSLTIAVGFTVVAYVDHKLSQIQRPHTDVKLNIHRRGN